MIVQNVNTPVKTAVIQLAVDSAWVQAKMLVMFVLTIRIRCKHRTLIIQTRFLGSLSINIVQARKNYSILVSSNSSVQFVCC